ncbi:VOC family protein [Caulobacter segnis]|nr:VOC family protein [Caulobacter segnis]
MRIVGFHHVKFGVTDIATTERFATDFGLKTVETRNGVLYMKTAGGDAYNYVAEPSDVRRFLGMAFAVEDISDLEQAVRDHGATPIVAIDGPGGGYSVSLTDPEGQCVWLVTGIAGEHLPVSHRPLALNVPDARTRFNAAQSTRALQPAHLFRLGHIGLYVKDFATMAAWYERVLGLKASDTMFAGEPDHKIAGFFRIDRGADYVDHHVVFLAQWGKTDAHHISFEIEDFEAQFIAHRWLESRGWKPNWGVGRHPLGSHVFDVWFDPDGYRFETFSDTDLVNNQHQGGNYDVKEAQMDLWSSESPERYFA